MIMIARFYDNRAYQREEEQGKEEEERRKRGRREEEKKGGRRRRKGIYDDEGSKNVGLSNNDGNAINTRFMVVNAIMTIMTK